MSEVTRRIQSELLELQDVKYKEFNSKLIPNIDNNTMIGIRTPSLREYSRKVYKTMPYKEFLHELPHSYYEENNLHMFVIGQIKDFDECMEETKRFLPYIDNWATCDVGAPKIFAKNKDKVLEEVKQWLRSEHDYTVRYGIGMLMRLYLDEDFKLEYATLVANVRSEEYYVNMMIAWYFATALAKQYSVILPYLEQNKLDTWTHNKAIQKACESFRITKEQKEYLRTLKRK